VSWGIFCFIDLASSRYDHVGLAQQLFIVIHLIWLLASLPQLVIVFYDVFTTIE